MNFCLLLPFCCDFATFFSFLPSLTAPMRRLLMDFTPCNKQKKATPKMGGF